MNDPTPSPNPRSKADALWQVTYIGSATLLFEGCGLRLITDPVLDPAGHDWPLNRRITHPAYRYSSTLAPGLDSKSILPIDVVLLSHDQHRDNFDPAGLAMARQAKCILTSPSGARRLRAKGISQVIGLSPGEQFRYPGTQGPVTVIATPARHGRFGTNWLAGEVIGFIVQHPALGRCYISGDTLWFDGLRTVASHGAIDVAFIHLGNARFGRTWLRRWLRWSMSADEAVTLCRTLAPRWLLPIHFEGWSHYTEGRAEVSASFASAGLSSVLRWLPRGKAVGLDDADLDPSR